MDAPTILRAKLESCPSYRMIRPTFISLDQFLKLYICSIKFYRKRQAESRINFHSMISQDEELT